MKLIIILLSLLPCWSFADAQFGNPLIQAVNEESSAEVKKLAQNKKLLSSRDSEGQDALYHAVSLNDPKIVKILLEAGASTQSLYNDKKETLLFEATRLGSVEIIEMLLKKNPKLLNLENSDQETVLFEAARANQNEVVRFFLKKGLGPARRNKSGKTAQDYAHPANQEMKDIFKKSAK